MSGPSCLVCVSPGHTVGGWDQTCAAWHSPELLSLTLIRDTQSWRSSKGHLRVVLVNHNTFYFGRSLRDLAFSRCVSMLIDGDRLSLGRKILLQCCFLIRVLLPPRKACTIPNSRFQTQNLRITHIHLHLLHIDLARERISLRPSFVRRTRRLYGVMSYRAAHSASFVERDLTTR